MNHFLARNLIFALTACMAVAGPAVKWGEIPLSFEPNTGQAGAPANYVARGSAYTLYLGDHEAVLGAKNEPPLRTGWGGGSAAQIVPEARQVSTSNYFIGSDPSKWHTSVPNYERVRYIGVYPGIDLLFYGNDGKLEYD